MLSLGNARMSWPKPVKSGPRLVLTLYVLTAIELDEEKPSALSWSKATASALPMRSWTMRNPPRSVLLFSPKKWRRYLFPELGDQAKATAGAKLFQSCG